MITVGRVTAVKTSKLSGMMLAVEGMGSHANCCERCKDFRNLNEVKDGECNE